MTDFTDNEMMLVGTLVCAVMIWPILMRLLANTAEPSRQEMADIGSHLMKSKNLTSDHKDQISMMLEDAYGWHFMFFACLFVPIYIIGRKLDKIESTAIARVEDEETRKDFHRFFAAHMKSTAAANPLCALLLMAILTVLFIFILACGQVYRFGDILVNCVAYSDQHLIKVSSLRRS